MSATDFLRLAKLKGVGKVSRAARHNRRVIQAELGASGNIDPTRTHLNETLTGPPSADDVATLARDMMRAAGIEKTRKDAVLALEIVFSLTPAHQLDEHAFFSDCVRWAGNQFGGAQNILSADIHRDEAAPHCHVLILPLLAGRMVGSDMMGGRTKLRDTRQRFHEAVGSKHGLAKAPPKLLGATKTAAAAQVHTRLRAGSDGALRSKLWAQFKDSIDRDPGPYLLALGINPERPPKKLRPMTQIFTSKGRGPARDEKPIRFQAHAKPPSLCSVGFAARTNCPNTPAIATAPASPPQRQRLSAQVAKRSEPADGHGQEVFERVREDNMGADLYDQTTGEFFKPCGKASGGTLGQSTHWQDPDPDAAWFENPDLDS